MRTAFASASSSRLLAEDSLPAGAAPEDVADEAVASGRRFTVVPARIKRIDRGLARLGVDWCFPTLAGLDPGRSDSRLAGSDLAHIAVQAMLTGGKGINMGTIGAFVRALGPAGGIAPLAGQVEYRWPINRGEEPGLPDDDEVLATLLDGGGDLRDQARNLAMTTPAAELLDAYCLAVELPGWADRTCAAVEREIAAGQLGDASSEWAIGAIGGLTRLLLSGALRDRDAAPASTAGTALMLIFIRNKVRTLRQLVPAASFDVLDNPMVAPSFLADFLNR